MDCESCGTIIERDEASSTMYCARIERGHFSCDAGGEDYIKAGFYVCEKCYLEDPDLCRFFNRIGWTAR